MTTPVIKAKKKPSVILIILGICVSFCIISCGGINTAKDSMELVPTATPPIPPSATPLPTATTPPLPPTTTPLPIDQLKSSIETALGTGNRDVTRLTGFDWSETNKNLNIYWAINNNSSSELIMAGIQTDITDMLKIISQSGLLPDYQSVTFVGTFPLQDAFGNVSEDRVVTASYNKTTVDKVNWENFLYTDIFVIADISSIHSAMTEP